MILKSHVLVTASLQPQGEHVKPGPSAPCTSYSLFSRVHCRGPLLLLGIFSLHVAQLLAADVLWSLAQHRPQQREEQRRRPIEYVQQYGALEGRDYPRECQDLYHGLPYFQHVKTSWQQPVCEPQVRPCCGRHTGIQLLSSGLLLHSSCTALAEPLPCYALQEGAVLGSSLRCHYQMDEYPEMHCTGANLALDLRKFEVSRCGFGASLVMHCSWLRQIKACHGPHLPLLLLAA